MKNKECKEKGPIIMCNCKNCGTIQKAGIGICPNCAGPMQTVAEALEKIERDKNKKREQP